METRVLIAYVLIALVVVAAMIGLALWQRSRRLKRRWKSEIRVGGKQVK